MLENKRHLLNNGFSFLAVETGSQGEWSRNLDLQKCISRISKRPTFITLYYAHESTTVSAYDGGLEFSFEHNPPICLGLYKVSGKQNGFTLKGLDEKLVKESMLNSLYKNNKDFIDKYNEDLQTKNVGRA
mgnify:CR=1 FL=1